MFKHLSIREKILSGFLLILIIFSIFIIYLFTATSQITTTTVNTVRTVLLLMSFCVLLLTFAIGYVFSFFITKSIKQLVLTVHQISEGNLSARVAILSHDEIGKLGTEFNTMASRLQEKTTELANK